MNNVFSSQEIDRANSVQINNGMHPYIGKLTVDINCCLLFYRG